jgi:hypothetical protein
MKKYFIDIGAIFIAILLMSTVTAVPQNLSKPTMDLINKFEDDIDKIESINFIDNLNIAISGGIIELLIQLIMLIIQFVMELVDFISNIMSLISLIQNLIEAITTFFQLFQELIDLIRSIFNPSQFIAN